MNRPITLIDAPSNLGLKPLSDGGVPGVYLMPDALRKTGLLARLDARDGGRVQPLPYDPAIHPETGIRNAHDHIPLLPNHWLIGSQILCKI